jgi:hypothetical protein
MAGLMSMFEWSDENRLSTFYFLPDCIRLVRPRLSARDSPQAQLAPLDVERQDRVHDRTPAIHVEDLAGNKARFIHA